LSLNKLLFGLIANIKHKMYKAKKNWKLMPNVKTDIHECHQAIAAGEKRKEEQKRRVLDDASSTYNSHHVSSTLFLKVSFFSLSSEHTFIYLLEKKKKLKCR
jgi:pyrroline-5-carboxylate reductase